MFVPRVALIQALCESCWPINWQLAPQHVSGQRRQATEEEAEG